MAQYDLGKTRITPKGIFSYGKTYTALDVVYFNGTSYVYINTSDSAGNIPTNTTYWAIFAGGILVTETLPEPAAIEYGQVVCVVTDDPLAV